MSAEAASARAHRVVRRVRLAVVALMVAAAAAELAGGAWPLLLWPMYARAHPEPPTFVSEWEVRWIPDHGDETTVLPAELYTHVHAELGRRVVAGAGTAGPDRTAYQRAVERRLRHAFGADAPGEVRIRRLHWNVDPHQAPPYHACCPDRVETPAAWRMEATTP